MPEQAVDVEMPQRPHDHRHGDTEPENGDVGRQRSGDERPVKFENDEAFGGQR